MKALLIAAAVLALACSAADARDKRSISGTFAPAKKFSGVVMQQGRVQVDNDFNSAKSRGTASRGTHFLGVPMQRGRVQLDSDWNSSARPCGVPCRQPRPR